MGTRWGVWSGRKYFLDKMNLHELVVAYLTYYAILAYLALAVLTAIAAVVLNENAAMTLLAAALVVPVYPLVWYLLHRYVLHGRFLYKNPLTVRVWKRIHFDHHQDPNDLGVLFGALYTTLPTIVAVTAPIGWAVAGPAGAAAAVAAALVITCFYEFCHCIQHLPFKPRYRWLKEMKRLHVAHHFHNEQGNFGITNFVPDRLFGTFYPHPRDIARSPTTFNLGYTAEEAQRYPWVDRLTPQRRDAPPRKVAAEPA